MKNIIEKAYNTKWAEIDQTYTRMKKEAKSREDYEFSIADLIESRGFMSLQEADFLFAYYFRKNHPSYFE